jgi:glycosyltransferase involved in cell wall biosynthesis
VRDRTQVISDGVDTELFRPRPRAAARVAVGLPPVGRRIAFVTAARSFRGKREDLARAAVAAVRGEFPDAELLVVSDVPFTKMPLYYAAADALLLTSDSEGSPNCVKEAIACGLGVLSTDVGDVREVLAGLTNCYVERQDVGRLAARLADVLRDGRGCPEGPDRARERYSPPAVAARFVAFYRQSIQAAAAAQGRR